MKKILKLNWLKWLPIIGDLFFIVFFYSELYKYKSTGHMGGYFDNPLSCYDFFTTSGYVTPFVSTICSFFIKNKWLKWLSVFTGIIVLVLIYMNVGTFNPY